MANNDLDENDLLRHTSVRQVVHGDEAVWIRSISAAPDGEAIVSVSMDNINLVGRADDLVDRLDAMITLIRSALAQPERWQELAPTRTADGHWAAKRPHPFSDRPRRASSLMTTGIEEHE